MKTKAKKTEPEKKPKAPVKKPVKKPAAPKKKAIKGLKVTKAKVKEIQQDLALVFDVETSGLIKNRSIPLDQQPEVCEFYASLVDLKTGEIISELDLLVKPSKQMSYDVVRIHGITNEMVAKARPFKDYASAIKKMIEAAPSVIAHNLSFDTEMIDIEMERCGLKVEWPRKICTVEQTVCIKGYRLNLSSLHEQLFGEKFSGAHRAKVDVAALTRCCVKLKEEGLI